MKCPNCNYEHGWSGEKLESIKGNKGDFFEMSNDMKMTRSDNSLSWRRHDETRDVFGCPSCGNIFIDP